MTAVGRPFGTRSTSAAVVTKALCLCFRHTALRAVIVAAILSLAAPGPPGPAAAGAGTSSDKIKKKIEGMPPEAQVTYLRGLLENTPGDARASFYLGNAYLVLDRPDSAIAAYEQAVALDSAYTKAFVNLGIALEELNRFDEARDRYEKALDIDSTDVLAHCHLGHYHHTHGDVGEAVRHYTRAIEIEPRSAQAHYNLGLAFADTRLFAEAIREWELVVALSPESELGRTAAENLRLLKTYAGEEPSGDMD